MAKMFQTNMVNTSKIRTNLLLASQPKSSNLHFEGKGLYCQKMQKLDTPQIINGWFTKRSPTFQRKIIWFSHLYMFLVLKIQNDHFPGLHETTHHQQVNSKTICLTDWREIKVLVVMFTSQCGCLKLHSKKPGEKPWFGNTCNLGPRSLPSRTLVTTHPSAWLPVLTKRYSRWAQLRARLQIPINSRSPGKASWRWHIRAGVGFLNLKQRQ